MERETELAKRRHRVRLELHTERRGPRDDIVVELCEQLDEVQPVADDAEAELLQVLLGEQEDGAAVDVVREEGGRELAEPERAADRDPGNDGLCSIFRQGASHDEHPGVLAVCAATGDGRRARCRHEIDAIGP